MRPVIPQGGKIRFDRQTTHSVMLATVIILALLTVLVATEPVSGETHLHTEETGMASGPDISPFSMAILPTPTLGRHPSREGIMPTHRRRSLLSGIPASAGWASQHRRPVKYSD